MNRPFLIGIVIFIFCSAGSGFLYGQRPFPNTNRDLNQNPIGSSAVEDTLASGILPLDTPVAMTYVLIADPDVMHSFSDTFSWDDNKHHPLLYHQSHLGNYGSPSRPLAPSINLKSGFSTGWDQYDPYFITADSFRYYNQNVPVAKIKYSQAGQEDTYLTLDFGRSFAKGFNLSFLYDRINQVGEFAHQHQKNTVFGLGVWHHSTSGRYDAFYNFISQGAVGEENGGIAAPELIGDTLFPDAIVPIHIMSGVTTHKHRLFTTKQILHLIADTSDFGIDIWLQGHFVSGLFKYVDEDAAMAAEYYKAEFLPDPRGIRQFTFHKEYQLTGGISLPWRAAHSTIHSSIRYRSILLQQEPLERTIKEMYWDASGHFQFIEPLELRGSMSFGLGQASGAFVFKAEGLLNTGILGKLEGYWSVLTRRPYMVETRLFVNQQLVYDFDFENPFTTEFGVGWNWEKQNLKAGIKWIVFDNYIFFDAGRKPVQPTQSFSLRRYHVSKDFDFNWIGIKGDFIWQPEARNELAIPELIYTASAYGRVKIFKKKVILMPGVDIVYHDKFRRVSYFPVIGRYHLMEGPDIPDYFRIDAALGIHINFLKVFARIEDLPGLWKPRVLYQSDYYPHYRGYIRIGVEAGFFN